MATTYDQMVRKVLMWANRDPDVFGASVLDMDTPYTNDNAGEIRSFLQYAADMCYRKLRVPPLEYTRTFDITDEDLTRETHNNSLFEVRMPVPDDLIEVLHIRNVSRGYVFNEKVDMRTYYDKYADKKEACYWTREGNEFLLTGFLAAGEVLELHYYRRLPALNAKYIVAANTYNADSSFFRAPMGSETGTLLYLDSEGVAFDESGTGHITGTPFVGLEAPHWLREENEKIVLFGALSEAFAYLGEDDQWQKYNGLFEQEIQQLNSEEAMRMGAGANIRINYNGFGQI